MEINGQPLWTKNEDGDIVSYTLPGIPVPQAKSKVLKKHNIIAKYGVRGEEWIQQYIENEIKENITLSNDNTFWQASAGVATTGFVAAFGDMLSGGALLVSPAITSAVGVAMAAGAGIAMTPNIIQKKKNRKEYNNLFLVSKEYVQSMKFFNDSLGQIVYKKKEEEFIFTAINFFNKKCSTGRFSFLLLILNYVSMAIGAYNTPPVILYLDDENWLKCMKNLLHLIEVYGSEESVFYKFDTAASKEFADDIYYHKTEEDDEVATPVAYIPPEIKRYSTGIHFYEENKPSKAVQDKLEVIDKIYAQIKLSNNINENVKKKLDTFYIPNVQKIIDGYKHYQIFPPKPTNNAVPMQDAQYKKMVEESVDVLYEIITGIGAQDDEWYINDAKSDLDVLKKIAVQDGLIDSQNIGAPSIKNFKNVPKKDAEKSV